MAGSSHSTTRLFSSYFHSPVPIATFLAIHHLARLPWGYLKGEDMTEGRIRWQVPLGSMQDFGGALSQPILGGSISLGGPIVTAGGHPKITEEKLGDSSSP